MVLWDPLIFTIIFSTDYSKQREHLGQSSNGAEELISFGCFCHLFALIPLAATLFYFYLQMITLVSLHVVHFMNHERFAWIMSYAQDQEHQNFGMGVLEFLDTLVCHLMANISARYNLSTCHHSMMWFMGTLSVTVVLGWYGKNPCRLGNTMERQMKEDNECSVALHFMRRREMYAPPHCFI